MKKSVIITIIIVIIAIVCVCVYVKNSGNQEVENITNDQVVTEENIVNTVNEIEETNESNNIVEEVQEERNVVDVAPSSSVYETDSELGSTDRKQQAINKVKAYWFGDEEEDSSVSFRCDSVDSNGEIIVAVVSNGTVQAFYRVNLDKDTIDIEY